MSWQNDVQRQVAQNINNILTLVHEFALQNFLTPFG
jgi:hypothetical protein